MEFLRPDLLYLLPIASIPVIIHLLARLRLKVIRFPSIRFLSPTNQRKLSWFRIREIILLILRTLILLAILLTLARPRIKKGKYLDDIHLIIDDSYSMASSFEQAKKEAIRIINDYDIAGVRKLSESSYYYGSRKQCTNFVQKISVSQQHLTIDDLDNSKNKLLISDLTFPLILETEKRKDTIYSIEVGSANENLQVYAIRTADPIVSPGQKNRIKASLRNLGQKKSKTLIHLVSMARKETREITIPPGQLKSVIFDTPFDRSGTYYGYVAISQEEIDGDNKRFFVLRIPERVRIGCFYRDSLGLGYLKAAFRAASYQYQFLDMARIGKTDLSQFDILILYDISDCKPWTARFIKGWINQKKAVIIFITKSPKEHGLAIFRNVLEPISWQKTEGFQPIRFNNTHPVFSFTENKAKVFQYLRSKIRKGEVLARAGDDPLIILNDNLVIFNTGLVLSDTDLALKAAFIPLIYRLISFLTIGGRLQYTIGERLKVADYDIMVEGPKGNIAAKGGVFVPQIPGLYKVMQRIYAVNVDPSEGNIKKIPPKLQQAYNIFPFQRGNVVKVSSLLILLALVLILIEIIIFI